MNNDIRALIDEHLRHNNISRADLARLIDVTPQEVTRALNGGTRGGTIPPIWQKILEALGLELTVQEQQKDD